MVTHLGQVLVFDAHRGTVIGTPLDLVAGVDPPIRNADWPTAGPARPECPVAAAPAFSEATGIVVLALWEPGADKPVLVGLRYRPGQTPLLAREWTSDAVGGGRWPARCCPRTARRCTSTAATSSCGRSTATTAPEMVGATELSRPDPAVGHPDGLIIAGGGPGARLMAIRDTAEKGEKAGPATTRRR